MSHKSCGTIVFLVVVAQLIATSSLNSLTPLPVLAADKPAVTEVFDQVINNKTYQVSRTVIKARPEQIWQVLTDFNDAANVFSNVKKCQVLSERGSTKILRQTIRPTGTLTTFQYDLELKTTPARYMEWRRISGDFKEVNGFWRLEPLDGGRKTLVTYANYVNGGFFMPQPFIRHQSRVDFPRVMACLKARAESGTEIAARNQARPAD